MKLKDKVKTYSFWVSLTSALILILKLISTQLGFSFDEKFASDLITTLCSVLVILGIIVTPSSKDYGITYSETIENIETPQTETLLEKIEDDSNEDSISVENNENVEVSVDIQDGNPTIVKNNENVEVSVDIQDENPTIVKNETNENNQIETPTQSSEEVNKTDDFRTILDLKQEQFSNDINHYVEILQSQINKITNRDY